MFLHKLEGSWLSHPFWRRKFLLDDPEQLADLKASSVEWVEIDISKGQDVTIEPHRPVTPATAQHPTDRRQQILGRAQQSRDGRASAPAIRSTAPAFDPLSKTPRSMGAEMPAASALARRSTKMMQTLYNQVRLGKAIKTVTLEPMIDEITSSIQRNPHAFSGLVRIKKTSEYLYSHALSVCALMINLAQQLKLGAEQTRQAGLAGLLMDIGMGHVPEEIYNKDGTLTPGEEQIIHSHTRLAHEFLTIDGNLPEAVVDVCLHHHERLNGSGYPDGLVGDQISLFSRMAAICDAYDAMTSRRPHKTGRDPSAVLVHLSAMTELYDPILLEAFIRGVGIYPVGSLVRLGSDRLAIVYDQNGDDLTLPRVRAFYSIEQRGFVKPDDIDLANCFGKDMIVGREAPEDWNIADWEALSGGLIEKANAALR